MRNKDYLFDREKILFMTDFNDFYFPLLIYCGINYINCFILFPNVEIIFE